MEAKLQPRTGDAFLVIVTDDKGEKHRVQYWPDDSDINGERAEACAIEYVQKRLAAHG